MITMSVSRESCWLDGRNAGRLGVRTVRRVEIRVGCIHLVMTFTRNGRTYEPCRRCGCGVAFRYADDYGTEGFDDSGNEPYVWTYCPKCRKHTDLQEETA